MDRHATLAMTYSYRSHSARSEAESRNPEDKKDMDAATDAQHDVNNQAPTLLAMAPGKNNARNMSHSEMGKARRGYPENNKIKRWIATLRSR